MNNYIYIYVCKEIFLDRETYTHTVYIGRSTILCLFLKNYKDLKTIKILEATMRDRDII